MNSVQPLQEYLTDMVIPEKRNAVKILPDHVTMLHGTKSKKQHTEKKRRKTKSTIMTRREYASLGLFTLPTRQLKYKEFLPLHQLWKGYAQEHLGLNEGDTIPQLHEPTYDAFSKLLVKMDLHGANIRVIESKSSTLLGLAGIIVLETKNVLKVLGEDDHLRTIPKSECNFGMRLGNIEFTIFGKHLTIRPAERSVKKIKTLVEPLKL
ncbi:ribonuclease P protein subunit p29-like [Teleopsis dalmanni]|uniref:ribonuclease P protein subunit p29-like n=1 Tax=Teleopsis dalmanni TaxID=139649 RepID=UPI0018CE653A|nr:ribonuclease P protein subunit p29-like [Teleopsis dalmanni]